MADITVRRMKFQFPETVPVLAKPGDIVRSAGTIGLSMTLPYLEPYLIRTMNAAEEATNDTQLIADMQAFSGQESNHYRNHARINKLIKAQLPPELADKFTQIEAALEADYQRFSREKSLKWNLAYAEGFEALTFGMAQGAMDDGFEGWDESWADLMEWHLAEEIEHRSVTFDAYHKIYGGYFYRTWFGIKAQWHFLGYVYRFSKEIEALYKDKAYGPQSSRAAVAWKYYRRTLSPDYNPGKIDLTKETEAVLRKYDLRVSTQPV